MGYKNNLSLILSLMIKSSSIFKKNGAHLIEKKEVWKNKDCPLYRFKCFEHEKNIFDSCQALNM
jgi:hypothetical protein